MRAFYFAQKDEETRLGNFLNSKMRTGTVVARGYDDSGEEDAYDSRCAVVIRIKRISD